MKLVPKINDKIDQLLYEHANSQLLRVVLASRLQKLIHDRFSQNNIGLGSRDVTDVGNDSEEEIGKRQPPSLTLSHSARDHSLLQWQNPR